VIDDLLVAVAVAAGILGLLAVLWFLFDRRP
jgi:hypothetical protein